MELDSELDEVVSGLCPEADFDRFSFVSSSSKIWRARDSWGRVYGKLNLKLKLIGT